MSNYTGYGTVSTDTSTASVKCRGWTTLCAHLDSGTGTWTWEFMGADGVWRVLYGAADNITAQAYTATHMVNIYFGSDVLVRGTGSSGSSPQWDWQILGNLANRSN